MGIVTIGDAVTPTFRPIGTGGLSRDCAWFGTDPHRWRHHRLHSDRVDSLLDGNPLTAFNITISASPVDMFVAGALSVALLASASP